MGRIRTNIRVNDRDCWTLFDSGSRNTYVVKDTTTNLPKYQLPQPRSVTLGGKVQSIDTGCVLIAEIEGLPIKTEAYILNDIGLDEERLDMSHYPKEFLELLLSVDHKIYFNHKVHKG